MSTDILIDHKAHVHVHNYLVPMLIFALKCLDIHRHPSVPDVCLLGCVLELVCICYPMFLMSYDVQRHILRYLVYDPSSPGMHPKIQRGCYRCSSAPFALTKFKLSCIDIP